MAIAYFATMPFNAMINAFPNKKLMNYRYREQFVDILPSLALSLAMGCVVYMIGMLSFNIYLKLLVQVVTGAIIYIFGAKIFRFESFNLILKLIKKED